MTQFRSRQLVSLVLVVSAVALLAGCAARRAFQRGESSALAGDWDAAVAHYRQAVQSDPDRAEYKIALERAMLAASRIHFDRARDFEQKDMLDQAMLEYRRASEYDPANRQAASKAAELERTIRDRIEAARPKPPIEEMRQRARQATPEPILNPASREPLQIRFNNASLRDILNFIANATGINVTYDRDFQDRPYTVQLDGVTLEQALNQILTANALFYKVLNERTIIVVPDSPTKRAQYEEQVIRTFFISHADVQELSQLVNQIARIPQAPIQPTVVANKTSNTITIRASTAIMAIIEQVVAANDKPRAEVVVDVEILEVNRTRAKQFGLNLTQYALGGIFSPEVAPPNQSTQPQGVTSPPPFNVNTISQGVSTADFYGAVPAAFVRFLETDSQTKLIAKPQLRGAEGSKLTLNLGDEIPVPSTTFTPIATGGTSVNPLTSFNYRPVGVNLELTPRVTYEGDIILELLVESSSLGQDINVAGQSLPSFGSRKVTTKLRLREGESNLLAGLLREDERRSLRGFPGAIRLPILRQLFSDNDENIAQTDIVMLLTPRVVRTHELTQRDVSPIYIGTQQNIGLGGPPPLLAPPPEAAPPPPPAGAPLPAGPGAQPGVPVTSPGARPGVPTGTPTLPPGVTVPPGSSPIPGTTTAPPPTAPTPAPATPAPQPTPAAPAEPPVTPPPAAQPTAAGAQIIVSPPGPEFRIDGGPYTVPISINGASQVSVISLTLTYPPNLLRVRSVQEGSFMRQGGTAVVFAQQVDATTGRIDITLTRTGDVTGASGSGLVAALLLEATAAGTATLSPSGIATTPAGTPVSLQFSPVTVTTR